MLDNIGRIDGHVAGLDRDGLARGGLRRDAVERRLPRICAKPAFGTAALQKLPADSGDRA
ncbi:MAG TPA: hypothetical protein VFE12_22470 [Acetobacteraceae bacterium]|jgi:hypothetical protein|nr:hypothetical protein [Acetobacteraceae bacterium]